MTDSAPADDAAPTVDDRAPRLGRVVAFGLPAPLFVVHGGQLLTVMAAAFVAVPAARWIRITLDRRERGHRIQGEARAARLAVSTTLLGGAAVGASLGATASPYVASADVVLLLAAYLANAMLTQQVREHGLGRLLGHGLLQRAVVLIDEALDQVGWTRRPSIDRTGSFPFLTALLVACLLTIAGLLGLKGPVEPAVALPGHVLDAVTEWIAPEEEAIAEVPADEAGDRSAVAERDDDPGAGPAPDPDEVGPTTTEAEAAEPCAPIDREVVPIPSDMADQADRAVRTLGGPHVCVSNVRSWIRPDMVVLDTESAAYVVIAWRDGPALQGRDGAPRAAIWWTEAFTAGREAGLLEAGTYPGDLLACPGALALVVDAGGALASVIGSPDYGTWNAVTSPLIASLVDLMVAAGSVPMPTGAAVRGTDGTVTQPTTEGALRPTDRTVHASWSDVERRCGSTPPPGRGLR